MSASVEHVNWCRDPYCGGCSCGHAFYVDGACRDCGVPQPVCPHDAEVVRWDSGSYCPVCDLQVIAP